MLGVLLALASLLPINGASNSLLEGVTVGQLAPPLGVAKWLRKTSGSQRDPSLAYFSGKVILVHAHQPEEGAQDSISPLASLLNEVIEATQDRRLQAISLVPAGKVQVFQLAPQGIHHVTGEVGADSPYGQEGGPVWLIGRAGEVRWVGSPLEDEAAFLAALDEAVRLPRGPRLREDPSPELRAAAEATWEADWAKALSLAKKVASKAGKGRDSEALAREAEDFVVALEAHEEDLLGQADGAVRSSKGEVYWRARLAIEHGFPRSAAAKQAKQLEKEAMRSELVLTFVDAEKYLTKVLPDRPILFPVRRSKEGDKYLRKLEKLVKASDNRAGVILDAAKQIERYREAQ